MCCAIFMTAMFGLGTLLPLCLVPVSKEPSNVALEAKITPGWWVDCAQRQEP
jgi:hypothetical protein